MSGIGMLVGLGFGGGLALIITTPGPWRAVVFHRRVAVALGADVRRVSLWQRLLAGQLAGGRQQRIEAKLARAGHVVDAPAHVLQRTAVAHIAMAAATGFAVVIGATGALRQPLAVTVLIPLAGVIGAVVHESRLDAAGRARAAQVAMELPAVAEALALAVAAGASVTSAVRVVGLRADGIVATELGRTAAAVDAGEPIDNALHACAQRLPFPGSVRFIEALRIALERGTPVAEVLRAQAADARHETRRQLLEASGRREIAMLLPVVFCILPAVVVIAFYPGMRQLALVAG